MPLNQPLFIGTPPDPLGADWIGISAPDGLYVIPHQDEMTAVPTQVADRYRVIVSLGAVIGLPLLSGLIAWMLLGL